MTESNCEYNFVLAVAGVAELSSELTNALFNAGWDDATLSMRNRILRIEFARFARSREDAISSAFAEVKKAVGVNPAEIQLVAV